MKKTSLIFSLFLFLMLASKASAIEPNYAADEVLIKLNPSVAFQASNELEDQLGVSGIKYLTTQSDTLVKVSLQDESVITALTRLKNNLLVESIQPNYLYKISSFTPDDPLYSYQWNFDQINVESAWDQDTDTPKYGGDDSIVVAVMDTGVAYEDYKDFNQAPDLASTNFVSGYDFVNNDSHPNDDNGHGTHMTGTIAQSTNNGVAMAGMAFNSSIMPIKVLGANGVGTTDAIIEGIEFAIENGVDVINMSFGSTDAADEAYSEALDEASDNGIVLVAAAGNSSASKLQAPASYDAVIGVGATQYDETKPSYSNYGEGLSVVAPGGNINVDQNNDEIIDGIVQQTYNGMAGGEMDYSVFNDIWAQGTSSATAHVSGAAALLLAAGVPSDNIQSVLETTAKDLGKSGYDTTYGYGLIDLEAAFELVIGDVASPTTTLAHDPEPDDSDNYYLESPTITLSASDAMSDVYAIYYRWGDDEYAEYTEPLTAPEGTNTLTYYAIDVAGNPEDINTAEYTVDTRRFVVGANAGGGPHVRVFSTRGIEIASFFVYAETFRGGVNVAIGDVDGDGEDEVVTAPGPGGGPQIRVFSLSGDFEKDFFAYDTGFRGGVNIAVGDVDGGKAEIVTAPMSNGGPNIRIFGYRSGSFEPTTENFMAYDENFRGGVSVAVADLEGNGMGEIITAPLSNGGPHIRIFGFRNRVFVPVILGLMAYDEDFMGGMTLAGGDVDGDGKDEIITGIASAGGPQIRIFGRKSDQTVILEHVGFMAFAPDFRGGINLATSDLQYNGKKEIVVSVRSSGSPLVRYFNREGTNLYEEYLVYAESFKSGVNLAAN